MTGPFAPGEPRLFTLPAGIDGPAEIRRGLEARLPSGDPAALSRVTILANSRRMARAVAAAWADGPARLLPRIRTIADLATAPLTGDPRPPVSPVRRRLELSQLVGRLLAADGRIAPRTALYDLADSLARLADEMHDEGVPAAALSALETGDLSGHWDRTLRFLDIAAHWMDGESAAPTEALRLRRQVETLAARWAAESPEGPMLVVGSTGSRGTTAALIEAVCRLPQGAAILPGHDPDLPGDVWDRLSDPGDSESGEDHPQYRTAALAARLDLAPVALPAWTEAAPPDPARNRLISLALRPAPVTDQWLAEAPGLGDLAAATARITLLEAPSPRAESETIALRIRAAVEAGTKTILVTPDRVLTRQVAAALDRWDIAVDDSAGTPLPLTAPGRLLRQVAGLMGRRLAAADLLALLKHPLVVRGGARGDHVLATQRLEVRIRKDGPPFPDRAALTAHSAEAPGWADWIADVTGPLAAADPAPVEAHIARHLAAAEALVAGPDGAAPDELWAGPAGREARARMAEFARHAEAGGTVSPADYRALADGILSRGEVRGGEDGHPLVLIRGTLEARVETAPLVILGGLVDGVWPPVPAPDPWLNRQLRREAGLLSPERQVGLSAHDFTQAAAAEEVWFTRALRTDEAQTVPSRWLNRIVTLIGGLPEQDGPRALEAMRDRGAGWLARAAALSVPPARVDPAPRPSPVVPVEARPDRLSVSDIAALIRDPYALYARKILGLYPLGPLRQSPDARDRGTALHAVLERFVREGTDPAAPDARARLLDTAARVLDEVCPWPTVRQVWLARFRRIAAAWLADEVARRVRGAPAHLEITGRAPLAGLGVEIVAKADRIDTDGAGGAWIYDYKTGAPPTKNAQIAFEKQLLIEAAMLDRGAFPGLDGYRTAGAAYIGLGAKPGEVEAPLEDHDTWDRLVELVGAWQSPTRGYTARIAPQWAWESGDHDHLARRGEWEDTDTPRPVDVARGEDPP
ncbi:double-strand break repair protein AddB [Wenxinia saemankumensis]|uniref:Double-strand break repair protein AddB n=1 Tax=Wenxinia saemankumensis TaxID=1447782 RepID=A0A1M6G375_9RHOB|nr:double-strand break repair protein AddB [Wenxinia saemankumensis]SHJ04370.1 double-strand break repair protein AddB [Wenxinia saemankumensis]